jgi:hypothetical protein
LLNGIIPKRIPPDKVENSESDELTSYQAPWLIVRALLALPFTFLFLLMSDIRWTSEGVERGPSTYLSFIPANCLVLMHVVLLSMWWTSFCLRIRGLSRTTVKFRLLCPLWLSALWAPKPPEHIDRSRPTGKHKRDAKQQQLSAALDEFAKGPSLKDRLLHRQPSARNRKFLLAALQIATSLSTNSIPNISLSCYRCLRNDLQ